jgi:cytochrome c-type biogenesis protein CcsB
MQFEQALLLAGSALFGFSIISELVHPGRAGRHAAFAGCLAALLALALRFYSSGRAPWASLPETAVPLALIVGLAAAYVSRRGQPPAFHAALAALAALAMLFAGLCWEPGGALPGALQSPWLLVHVPAIIGSYALFAAAAASSAAYVYLGLKKRADQATLARLDRISLASVALGTALLAAGIAMGAVWANAAWGAYWSWDPKETWSLITAAVYTLYLALRLKGVKGEDAAYVSLLGFASVLFTYFGVSYVIPGLHSYA